MTALAERSHLDILQDTPLFRPGFRDIAYAPQADEYVIYQAGEVMVHFADDQAKAQIQRKAILPLSSARAEVNSFLQGLTCREVCDRRLAYALQLALDGDPGILGQSIDLQSRCPPNGREVFLQSSHMDRLPVIADEALIGEDTALGPRRGDHFAGQGLELVEAARPDGQLDPPGYLHCSSPIRNQAQPI